MINTSNPNRRFDKEEEKRPSPLHDSLQSPDSAFGDDDETLPVLNTHVDFSTPSFSRLFCADGNDKSEVPLEESYEYKEEIKEDEGNLGQESVFVVDPNISPSTSDNETSASGSLRQVLDQGNSQDPTTSTNFPNIFENMDFVEILNAMSQTFNSVPASEILMNAKRRKVNSPRKRVHMARNKHRVDKMRNSTLSEGSNSGVTVTSKAVPSTTFVEQMHHFNAQAQTADLLNRIFSGDNPVQFLENTNCITNATDQPVSDNQINGLDGATIAAMLGFSTDNGKLVEQNIIQSALASFIAAYGSGGEAAMAPMFSHNLITSEAALPKEEKQIKAYVPSYNGAPSVGSVVNKKRTVAKHLIQRRTNDASSKAVFPVRNSTPSEAISRSSTLATPNSSVLAHGSEEKDGKMNELITDFFLNVDPANLSVDQMNMMQSALNTLMSSGVDSGSNIQEFIANLGKIGGLDSSTTGTFPSPKLNCTNYAQCQSSRIQVKNDGDLSAQETRNENCQPLDEKKQKRPRTTSKALYNSSASTAKATLLAASGKLGTTGNKTVSSNLYAARPCSGAEFLELEDLEEFANNFKKQRIKHGFTQGDVGLALGKRYGTDFSQTTISRFEALNLSYKNMCKLRPLLKEWLEEAETLIENGATVIDILEAPSPNYHSGQSSEAQNDSGIADDDEKNVRQSPSLTPLSVPRFISSSIIPQLKRRRKRTNLDNAQKAALDTFFNDNCRPDHQRMNEIAASLDLDPDVVRVWFCNRRQKYRPAHEMKSDGSPEGDHVLPT